MHNTRIFDFYWRSFVSKSYKQLTTEFVVRSQTPSLLVSNARQLGNGKATSGVFLPLKVSLSEKKSLS